MDEKGSLDGQALKVKVVCRRDSQNPHYAQDRSCLMVTVIECIATDIGVIPPMYIYKGGRHLLGWHAAVQDKEQAIFAWSTKSCISKM